MPASYVKAYVKRSKNDAADAAAICEAVTRPSMRFVPIKTIDQQGALVPHRCRDLLVRQRTQLINALRAHLAEIGFVAATGVDGVKALVAIVMDTARHTAAARTNEPGAASDRGATRGSAGSDRPAGTNHPLPASRERTEPAARDYSGHWRHWCHSNHGDRHRPIGLQVGTRARCMDRACPSTTLNRRSGSVASPSRAIGICGDF
jgi:Transposase